MSISVMSTKTLEDCLENGYQQCKNGKYLAFKDNNYIAIDNTQGDFFLEEFESLVGAIEWLK